jgi:glyoxylase I family protein
VITGFSHVQLVARDVAATVAWYTTVLGVEPFVRGTIASGPYAAFRHPGGFVLGVQTATGEQAAHLSSSAVDHLSFSVAGHDELEALRARLLAAGIETGPVFDEAVSHNVRLRDPDGLVIELTAPRRPSR